MAVYNEYVLNHGRGGGDGKEGGDAPSGIENEQVKLDVEEKA